AQGGAAGRTGAAFPPRCLRGCDRRSGGACGSRTAASRRPRARRARARARGGRSRPATASVVSRIWWGGPPLAHLAAERAAGDVEHGPLEAHEEPEQLRESGAVQRARGAVGRRLHGEGVAHTRHRDVALAAQLTGEDRAGRAPSGHVCEGPRAGARREPGCLTASRTARGTMLWTTARET